MSILKKTIAGALTIALSVGAIGTSAMPVLAASENNIDVLQKNGACEKKSVKTNLLW